MRRGIRPLLSRFLRYDYRGGAPLSHRLTNQSGEITASRVEGERVIEDVAPDGGGGTGEAPRFKGIL